MAKKHAVKAHHFGNKMYNLLAPFSKPVRIPPNHNIVNSGCERIVLFAPLLRF